MEIIMDKTQKMVEIMGAKEEKMTRQQKENYHKQV